MRPILLTTAFLALATTAPARAASIPVTPSGQATLASIDAEYGKLPISFEPNVGQVDEQVRFLSRGPGYSLFLTPAEAVLSLRTPGEAQDQDGNLGTLRHGKAGRESRQAVVRLSFDGANTAPRLQAESAQASRSNYLLGNDASRWQRDVANFGRVRYLDLYPGVDLVYYGNQQQLEYDLVVAAGTDPSNIALNVDGARRLRLDRDGNLVLATDAGDLVQHRPVAYQLVDGRRQPVAAAYRMLDAGRVGFRIGDYDRSRELVIDPVLVYSTYLGGTLGDRATDVTVDASKNAYVAGFSNSAAFPTKNAYQTKNAGAGDVFVAKFSSAGALVFSTYIGGAGADEAAGVAIDSSGNVYVTGRTTSLNYPTVSAYQTTLGGIQDAFVTKLAAAGNSLIYSTYLGGNANITYSGATGEYGYGIKVDANGSAIVSGWTVSTNFPVVGPIQANRSPAPAGCDPTVDVNKCARSEAFVTKFAANGASLIYSTYLGGTEYDESYSLALDGSGNAYITGTTTSANFPTAAPKQGVLGANGDAFVTKINPAGSAMVYSTFLGGAGQDLGYGIAVDSTGAAYVAGVTASSNFPVVTPAQSFNSTGGGSATDGFVTKVAPAGNAWVYSTFIGGTGSDSANGISVDSAGNAYITGQTTSTTGFPIYYPIQATLAGNTDAFLTKLAASGSAFVYSTYLGGSNDDFGFDVAVDSGGDAYVVGYSSSTNFPVASAYQATNAGSQDGFLARVSTAADPMLSINDVSITEGNSGTKLATFTVSLSKTVASTVSFSVATADGTATAGSDYVALSLSNQTIAAGSTSKTVSVTINGDTTAEDDETFFVNLSNVVNAQIGDGQGVGTILNDDAAAPLTLSIADASITEGNSGTKSLVFTVTQSGVSANNTTFNIATSDGTAQAPGDYVAKSTNGVTIAAGNTTATFSVTINGDGNTEPDETFFVTLSNASGATIARAQAVGTIINDDSAPLPSISVNSINVTEGNSGTTAAVFTVSLSTVAAADVTFNVFTSSGTAAAPSDFTAINLSNQVIPAGSSNKTFTVLVNGDTQVEGNETFFLNLSNVSGATVANSQGTCTILNDDSVALPAINVNDVQVVEGNSGTVLATFTVQLSAVPTSTVTFDVNTANGTATAPSDYIALALSGQTIAAGVTSKSFNVTINGDTAVEGDETFTFNVTNASGATISRGQATGTILNDDINGTTPPQISVSDVSVAEGDNGNKSATFTISLSAPSPTPVTFDVFTSNGTASDLTDYVGQSTSSQIAANQLSTNFVVQLQPDSEVEPNETFTVNLNNVVGATILKGQGLGTILNDDEATVSISGESIPEGNSGYSTAVFTITLSQPMPTPVTFNVATSNGTASAGSDYEARSVSGVLLDAGRTRATFYVKVYGDTTSEPDETIKATLSNITGAGNGSLVGTVTILNDDAAAMPISAIQGVGALSPVEGQKVQTEGVVTAITADGFYLQTADAEADADPRTSEGLFVASAGADVAVGDKARVSGQVVEARIGTGSAQLTQTQLQSSAVEVLDHGLALPRAQALVADAASAGTPTAFERFEGMRVALAELTVVAPSGGTVDEATGRVRGDGRFYGVASGLARPFLEPGLNALAPAAAVAGISPKVFDTNPERVLIDSAGQRGGERLSADAGDRVSGLVGVLGYGYGAYRLMPDPQAAVSVKAAAVAAPVSAALASEATIGSFHLRRFLDDRRDGSEPVLAAGAYATRLAKAANAICAFAGSPDILGLSGLENGNVLKDIASAANAHDGNLLFPGSCEGATSYSTSMAAGSAGQAGFLVNTAAVRPGVPRVQVLSVSQAASTNRFRQRDGSHEPLFAQAPQVLQVRINQAAGASRELTIVQAQVSALSGDLDAAGSHGWAMRGDYLRALRSAQARAIATLVQQRQAANPAESLVLLGDFESAQFDDGLSDTMGVVSGRTAPHAQVLGYEPSPLVRSLSNLTTGLPAAQRYTVVREGNAQAVDHILVNAPVLMASPAARVEVARVNADFGEDNYADAAVPVRVSDHDPVVLYLDLK